MKKLIKRNKQERFEKVVELKYPNGDKYYGTDFSYYVCQFIFYFVHIMVSIISAPFTFKDSGFAGYRKVYWRRVK